MKVSPRAISGKLRLFALIISITGLNAPQVLAAQALSGDTVRAESGAIIRLSGLHAPLAATPELATQAKRKLDHLITHPESAPPDLGLGPPSPRRDRYGRLAAQAYVKSQKSASPVWLQGELLRQGLAFAYPPTGDEPNLDDLLAAETEARRARRGIWNDPFYLGKPATGLTAKDEGRYAFVRGKVEAAVRIKNKVYLNFGPDWRSDFTVMIAARNLKPFRTASLDPLTLKGQTILVRGWIKHNFGPMIEVTHPAQIATLKDQE